MLNVGDRAPEFTLPTSTGGTVSLRELRGKKIVLYFYPKDDTPGCTKEACSFEEHTSEIKKKGAVVLGVSTDSVESHQRFAKKYGLSFPLVSDSQKEIVSAYGVWKEKSFMGKKYMGIERTTFVIDEKGFIRKIFEKVRVDGHTKEVLEALAEIRA